MKKLTRIDFTYEDGSKDLIIDPRACLLFQSRCNSNGILSGMEEAVFQKSVRKPLWARIFGKNSQGAK